MNRNAAAAICNGDLGILQRGSQLVMCEKRVEITVIEPRENPVKRWQCCEVSRSSMLC
jgi:hypothetical protein